MRERFGLNDDRYVDASILIWALLRSRTATSAKEGAAPYVPWHQWPSMSDGARTQTFRAAARRVADELIRRGACRGDLGGDERALGLAMRLELLPQAEAMMRGGCRPTKEDQHAWLLVENGLYSA